MGELKKWREENWVRIGTDGKIKGPCGTSKNKKNPDRCLPMAKAKRLSKRKLASTARKKKKEGAKGKQFVKNVKGGGPRVRPGTSKGDSYCARSYGIKMGLPIGKRNDPNTPNNLSRKRWKCVGKKSKK